MGPRARELKASAPGAIAPAIARWKQLVGTENQGFDAYAGFILAWPGFPLEESMRRAAEKSWRFRTCHRRGLSPCLTGSRR
jgi:soluble lytic murein transglycosylase